MHGLEQLLSFAASFFPPYLKWSYLKAIFAEPVPQTLAMAFGGSLIALTVGFMVSLWIAVDLPGARALYTFFTLLRAIPDLTLAILCVIGVGIGPGAGMLALGLFYSAAIGKIYADLFRTADQEPIDALSATGAGRLAVFLFGPMQLRMKDLLSYGSFEFESAMRASVIVGAVGGGGLGTEIVGTINAIDFRRTSTLVLILVLLVALIDQLAQRVKRRPVLLWGMVPLGLLSIWFNFPEHLSLKHAINTYRGMLPPSLPRDAWHDLPRLLLETLYVAFGGTIIASVAAVPLGFCAARNLGPAWVCFSVRRLLEFLRAIPEVVWGLLLVGAMGVGPRIGLAALALHATGSLGRLYSESFENITLAPVHAIQATGAPFISTAAFGFLPLALPPMAAHTLFRLEWNMRAATIVGVIGAGGIGEALYNAQQLQFYPRMLAYLCIIALMVLSVDQLSAALRRRWKLLQVAVA
jgi:phosphonate transport system permease protein